MSFFQKNKKLIDILFWVGLIGFAVYKFGYQRMAPSVDFAQLEMVDATGKTYTRDTFTGKNVFVNFYQSWCGPCMQEMPFLDNAAAQLRQDNFVFIAVSDESFELINRVQAKSGTQMLFLQAKESLSDLGIRAYPTSYLLNTHGEVLMEEVSAKKWDKPERLKEFREMGY
jgi:thiol-disulfide isomerase/thioredoxin